MKSAEEWKTDLEYHCYSTNDGGGLLGFGADAIIRAIQEDALRAAAEKCASLSNGEHRLHPDVEWSAMDKRVQEIAHWAFQNASAEIMSLIPGETK